MGLGMFHLDQVNQSLTENLAAMDRLAAAVDRLAIAVEQTLASLESDNG